MRENLLVRLVGYYLVTILVVTGIFRVFPIIPECIELERSRQGARFSLGADPSPSLREVESIGAERLVDPLLTIPVITALVLAFFTTVPVAWVYRWTRPRKRYNQTFAHTLLVVPIAIALVVFLVKGSLALAFSLAGIVAAVRFRTNLNEPMDAVYMFIVIGIGLAAGVQLLAAAILASIIFNTIALCVWRWDWGGQPAVLSGWRIVPAEETAQLLGVSGVVLPDAEGDGPKKAFNTELRIHTKDPEAAHRAAAPVLDEHAKAWQVAQVVRNEDGTSFVEIDVRLKKAVDLAAFIREIELSEEGKGTRVELKSRPPAKAKKAPR